MAVKTLPSTVRFKGIEWRLQQPSQINRSGYTGARQVIGNNVGKWAGSIEFVPFENDAAIRQWRGFLSSLEGQVHTFYLPVVISAQHAGSNPTATVAAGASSATLSSAIGLKTGQYMTFTLASGKRQMVILTADMSGALATFRPPLREAATGTVETLEPYVQVALNDDTVAWAAQPAGWFALSSIEVEEAF